MPKMVEWCDFPSGELKRITPLEAIERMKICAANKNKTYPSDDMALYDFLAVNWARIVFVENYKMSDLKERLERATEKADSIVIPEVKEINPFFITSDYLPPDFPLRGIIAGMVFANLITDPNRSQIPTDTLAFRAVQYTDVLLKELNK